MNLSPDGVPLIGGGCAGDFETGRVSGSLFLVLCYWKAGNLSFKFLARGLLSFCLNLFAELDR
jgi:hypothetical protein